MYVGKKIHRGCFCSCTRRQIIKVTWFWTTNFRAAWSPPGPVCPPGNYFCVASTYGPSRADQRLLRVHYLGSIDVLNLRIQMIQKCHLIPVDNHRPTSSTYLRNILWLGYSPVCSILPLIWYQLCSVKENYVVFFDVADAAAPVEDFGVDGEWRCWQPF